MDLDLDLDFGGLDWLFDEPLVSPEEVVTPPASSVLIPVREMRQADAPPLAFPGYCLSPTGEYIGGIGNDCRYYRGSNKEMCAVHAAQAIGKDLIEGSTVGK